MLHYFYNTHIVNKNSTIEKIIASISARKKSGNKDKRNEENNKTKQNETQPKQWSKVCK